MGVERACQSESSLAYGDVLVIDIVRNLLLSMSNHTHIAHYNGVMYLLYGKYSARCS